MNTLHTKLCSLIAAATLIPFYAENLKAGSATWKTDPESGNWSLSTNWSTGGPPDGPDDTATFGSSNVTAITFSEQAEVNGIIFEPGASVYMIRADPVVFSGGTLVISGMGIANNSGIIQTFAGYINFINGATAGSLTAFQGGFIRFGDTSTAGDAVFTNSAPQQQARFDEFSTAANSMSINSSGGSTSFHENSTAANGIFIANGATTSIVTGGLAGEVNFFDSSTAEHGTFICNGGTTGGAFGGFAEFFQNSTAGAATFIANGGSGGGEGGRIFFDQGSSGGTSRIQVFGNGGLDISGHNAFGVTVGSVEGSGKVLLGSNKLSVGSNNVSTSFSGVIQDGGLYDDGIGGSLAKIGSGTLILSGANTYTGATTVGAGKLIVNGSIVSAVTVNGGSLGGSGLTGAVTVNNGGILAPGNSTGILSVNGNLMLTMGAIYLVDLNGIAVGIEYDQTNVIGNVTLGEATLSLSLGFIPAAETMFTIINNDLSDLVTEMFNGLPDGATFTADGQLFTITYHGGDGNDVVLTVIPEPQTWLLFLAGVAALLALRKLIARSSSIRD